MSTSGEAVARAGPQVAADAVANDAVAPQQLSLHLRLTRAGPRPSANDTAATRRLSPARASSESRRLKRPASRGLRGSSGERGGAVALWVVLMVPLTVLAALIAMSVPLRLKAETSMRSATEDLAALLNNHVQNCNARPTDSGTPTDPDCLEVSLTSLCDEEDTNMRLCRAIDLVMRDLGTAGVDVDSLRGFYVHDVNNKADTALARDRQDVTSQTPGLILCTSDESSDPSLDPSLYVALVGDWSNGGWAPSQVWPDGRSVAGEAVRSERLTASTSTSRCPPGEVYPVDPGTLARDGTVTG